MFAPQSLQSQETLTLKPTYLKRILCCLNGDDQIDVVLLLYQLFSFVSRVSNWKIQCTRRRLSQCDLRCGVRDYITHRAFIEICRRRFLLAQRAASSKLLLWSTDEVARQRDFKATEEEEEWRRNCMHFAMQRINDSQPRKNQPPTTPRRRNQEVHGLRRKK